MKNLGKLEERLYNFIEDICYTENGCGSHQWHDESIRYEIKAIKSLIKECVPEKGIKGGQYGTGWDDAIDQMLDKLEEL